MSDSHKLSGKVHAIGELQTFESGFTKRELVIDTGGPYPDYVPIEFVKEKTAELDALTVGDDVVCHFNIRGNEWKGRYFSNLQAWRLEGGGKASAPAAAPVAAAPAPVAAPVEDDDIPF